MLDANVVVFHMRNLNWDKIPQQRRQEQYYVFFLQEVRFELKSMRENFTFAVASTRWSYAAVKKEHAPLLQLDNDVPKRLGHSNSLCTDTSETELKRHYLEKGKEHFRIESPTFVPLRNWKKR